MLETKQGHSKSSSLLNIFDLVLDREKALSLGEVFHKAVEGCWVSHTTAMDTCGGFSATQLIGLNVPAVGSVTAATRLKLSC